MTEKYLQASFQTHDWKSPDSSFRFNFAIIEPESELDNHPGLVLLSDKTQTETSVTEVSSLRKELPRLLENAGSDVIVYWRIGDDSKERAAILRQLTDHPVFHG